MYSAYQTAKYREQDVMNASPIRLVVMVYDVAIQACQEKDLTRSTRAISVLRDALNFDYAESAGLFRLYQWILDCLRNDDWESGMSLLKELRDSWATVEERLSKGLPLEGASPPPQPQGAPPSPNATTP